MHANMSKQGDNRNIRVLQFLDAYESQENLWNPALESYKNKLARDEAYMNIIKELNVPSLTIHDVKLKVKSIRTTYTKELRLLTKHKEEGKPYTPKLFWFHRANTFLKNVSLSREKRSNTSKQIFLTDDCKQFEVDYNIDVINRQNEMMGSSDDLIETNHHEKKGSPAYEYKTMQPPNSDSNILDENQGDNIPEEPCADIQIQEDFQSKTPAESKFPSYFSSHIPNNTAESGELQSMQIESKLDEFDLFCRSVAGQLRSISDAYSRSVAKLKIQQILFEAETGHYRSSPCITIPVTQNLNSL